MRFAKVTAVSHGRPLMLGSTAGVLRGATCCVTLIAPIGGQRALYHQVNLEMN